MIDSIRSWFIPGKLTRKQKVQIIRQQDKDISEKMAQQLEELEQALEERKCKKSSQSAKSGQG